jgi:hypothetical protein
MTTNLDSNTWNPLLKKIELTSFKYAVRALIFLKNFQILIASCEDNTITLFKENSNEFF